MSNVRVYLKPQTEGFVPPEGLKLDLERNTSRRYFEIDLIFGTVHPLLQDQVEEVTLQLMFSPRPQREKGIYTKMGARARLDDGKPYGYQDYMALHMQAPSLHALLDLLHEIKTGSIKPNQSFEGPQVGMTRAELEKKIDGLQGERNELHTSLERANRILGEVTEELQAIRRGLGIAVAMTPPIKRKIYQVLQMIDPKKFPVFPGDWGQ